jgi:hypothetical protein
MLREGPEVSCTYSQHKIHTKHHSCMDEEILQRGL